MPAKDSRTTSAQPTMDENLLAGKIALVTGANSGIGRAIALGYAQLGAKLAIAARREQSLQAVAEEARTFGVETLAVPTDVTDPKAVDHLMRQVDKHYGGLDILICNAGGNPTRGTIDEVDPAAWITAMNLNVTGAFLTARAAIPLMKARGGGRIVMLGSGGPSRQFRPLRLLLRQGGPMDAGALPRSGAGRGQYLGQRVDSRTGHHARHAQGTRRGRLPSGFRAAG